jgi:hypothetical protein
VDEVVEIGNEVGNENVELIVVNKPIEEESIEIILNEIVNEVITKTDETCIKV